MRPFATLDCETDPFKVGRIPKPFVWGFYDGKIFSHYTHDTLGILLDRIINDKMIVYAHNGGRFDYHFFLERMESFDSVKIINGRLAQFFIGNAEFRDSFNILPVALKKFELVDEYGYVLKKQDFDYALMEDAERYKPENWNSIIEYLKDDCVTLYHAIDAFQNEYGRHLTQAGAAMAQWKKFSKTTPPRSSKQFFANFKPYYYGGRVQCFRHGVINEEFSVFDINSAYPRAMLEDHPYGLDFHEFDSEQSSRNRNQGFFKILADSTGAFPYRGKTGLYFPDDGERREFFITGWELQAAIDTVTDGNHQVVKATYFDQLKSFDDYINHFFQKRAQCQANGDKAGDLFAKLLMNSLYGKFGSNPEAYAEYVILPHDELPYLMDENNQYSVAGELGPWLLAERPLDEDEMRYFNVATAASITGYVRAFLWRSICQTGKANMLYCDTDSIATTSEGHALDTGKMLGQWKFEGNFIRAGIGGKKMYVFEPKSGKKDDYKCASKGVKLSIDQLWEIANGKEILFETEVPTFSVHKAPAFVNRRVKLTK